MSEEIKRPKSWDDLFPKRFLKAEHLKGRKPVVEIVDFRQEDVGDERERGILFFKKTEKQLGLNVTNARCLEAMFGADPQACVGKRIVLCEGKARNPQTGQMGPCVRIYGSPDIANDIKVAIPRKKGRPEVLTMHATKNEAQEGKDGEA